MSRALGLLAAALLAVGALTSCTSDAMPVPTASPTPTPSGDGVLRIGTLFPSSGGTAFLGAGQTAGVNAAVREINEAGGVLGSPVVVVNRDAGDAGSEKAEQSFAELVSKGVDVIVGPSSSVVAERLLPGTAAAAIPFISPAATYPQLTTADADGWFFRTIPSYGEQGAVLAELLISKDAPNVALIRTGDDLGAALAETLSAGLEAGGGELVADVRADGDAAAVAAEVAAAEPDAVVLATADNGEGTRALISALGAAHYGGAKLWLTSQNLADYSQSMPAGSLTGVNGIVEGLVPDDELRAKITREDPGIGFLRYAAEAYDATILAALAATLAGDDGGASIRSQLRAASVDGIKCTSYGECLDVLATQDDIDYDGVTGPVNLDENGDLTSAGYAVYGYTAENKLSFVEQVSG